MKILAVGDIIGESGVKKAKSVIPSLKEKEKIDFIIINGENAAGGMGITRRIFDELIEMGANVVTLGNHTWGKKDIFSFIDDSKIIRPANYSQRVAGKGYQIYSCQNKKVAVINLIGRTEMGVLSENPFTVANDLVEDLKIKADLIIIDFHAEATAEKIAMAYYMDGKANIVFGTHTHVQTADEKVLPKGTAYITDIGMTGPKESVIGMDIDVSIKRFVTSYPERYKLAEGECVFNSCIFEIENQTNQVVNIRRYNE